MIPYQTLAIAVSGGVSRLSLEVSHPTYEAAYELFTPNKSGDACTLRITAAAGT